MHQTRAVPRQLVFLRPFDLRITQSSILTIVVNLRVNQTIGGLIHRPGAKARIDRHEEHSLRQTALRAAARGEDSIQSPNLV